MTTVQVCQILRNVCCKILVLNGEDIVSFGTGTIINARGVIITARHVVSDGRKILGDTIGVQLPGTDELFRYSCITSPTLSIDTGAWESRPFPLDLSLLVPALPLSRTLDYMPLRRELAPIGEEAVIAGFADDIFFPLDFTESFDTRKLEGIDKQKEFTRNEKLLRQLLCKKTMIGSKWSMKLGNWPVQGPGIDTAAYTLDTDVSYGASGGPVADFEGRLVAVTSKRGLGSAVKFEITTLRGDTLSKLPTGTSHALAHNIVTSILSPDDRKEA